MVERHPRCHAQLILQPSRLGYTGLGTLPKRPIPVTIISCLLGLSGVAGLVYHLAEFKAHPMQTDIVWVSLVRLLAIVAGGFMLRGSDWARWLAMVWIGFHVVVSYFHSWQQMAMHVLVFGAFAFFLFRPAATRYFRHGERE